MRKTIFVPLHGWSGAQVASTEHPDGPWITDTSGGEIRYEAHHYWDRDNSGDYPDLYAAEVTDAEGRGYTAGANPDALHTRILAELSTFTTWLAGADGLLGEFGFPWDADLGSWDALADAWLAAAQTAELWVAQWSAGEWWDPAYNLGTYIDGGLVTVHGNAAALEALVGEAPPPGPTAQTGVLQAAAVAVVARDFAATLGGVIVEEPETLIERVLTREERLILVSGDDVKVEPRIEVLSSNDVHQFNLTDRVTALTVRHSEEGAIRRTVDFTTDTELAWGRDRVRVWIRMTGSGYREEVSLGIFCTTTPLMEEPGRPPIWRVQGYDKAYLLDQRNPAAVSFAAGEPVLNAVRNLLAGANITQVAMDVEHAEEVLAEAKAWPLEEDVTRLDIINTLLLMICYEPLYFDVDGLAVAAHWTTPSLRPVGWRYDVQDAQSLVLDEEGRSVEHDLADAFNAWRLYPSEITLDDVPNIGAGTLVSQDNRHDGPASQEARGGLVVTRVEAVEGATVELFQLNAHRMIDADLRRSLTASFTSDVIPWHGFLENVEIVDRETGISGTFEHVEWVLDPFARTMTHTVRDLSRHPVEHQ